MHHLYRSHTTVNNSRSEPIMSAQSRFKKFFHSDHPTFDFPSTESTSAGKVLLPGRALTTITSRSARFTPTPASSSTASQTKVTWLTALTSSTAAKRSTFLPSRSHKSAANLSHRPKICSFNRGRHFPRAFDNPLSTKLNSSKIMTTFRPVMSGRGALRTVLIFGKEGDFHKVKNLSRTRALRASMYRWLRRQNLPRWTTTPTTTRIRAWRIKVVSTLSPS